MTISNESRVRKVVDHIEVFCESFEFTETAKNYLISKNFRDVALYAKLTQACWFYGMANSTLSLVRDLGFRNKDEFFQFGIDYLNEKSNAQNWKGWKCQSILALRKRLVHFHKAFKNKNLESDAIESIIGKRIGNKNARRIGDEQEAFIINQYCLGFGYKKVFKLYNERALKMIELKFWKPDQSKISISGMKTLLNRSSSKKIWLKARANLQLK